MACVVEIIIATTFGVFTRPEQVSAGAKANLESWATDGESGIAVTTVPEGGDAPSLAMSKRPARTRAPPTTRRRRIVTLNYDQRDLADSLPDRPSVLGSGIADTDTPPSGLDV
jgi:hypothetical protein